MFRKEIFLTVLTQVKTLKTNNKIYRLKGNSNNKIKDNKIKVNIINNKEIKMLCLNLYIRIIIFNIIIKKNL